MTLTSSLYCTHCGAIIEADGHSCFTDDHLSKLWSDIHKSFWRPRLGYTRQASTYT